jgi:O-succinylbenzoate synthase
VSIRLHHERDAARGINRRTISEWGNVDSRYTGPSAAFGQSIAAAEMERAEIERSNMESAMIYADEIMALAT